MAKGGKKHKKWLLYGIVILKCLKIIKCRYKGGRKECIVRIGCALEGFLGNESIRFLKLVLLFNNNVVNGGIWNKIIIEWYIN